jgi:predicted flap endonuclease-1-like 5' DNA nuclease
MYEHFNPLNLENAWLQHLILFAVAGVLGYIIGYQRSKIRLNDYLGHLARLEADLAQCFKMKTQPAAAPAAKPAKIAEPLPVVAAPPVPETDDLKKIEGIGPKIEQILHESGIRTFAQLSQTEPAHIMELLRAAGPQFQIHDPGTWPDQARLAAQGKWDELKVWQDELNKGKSV